MKDSNKSEQNSTISTYTGLTPQQEQACMMLASGEGYTTVAAKLGINRGTLYKWQDNVAFRCFYNKQCSDYIAEVKNGLIGLHSEAIATVREMLTGGSEATRLKAAIWVLEKVEAVEVGATNVREALKNQATKSRWSDDDWVTFDKKAYQQSLKEFGLSDE